MKIYVKIFKATFRNAPPPHPHNINKIHVTSNVSLKLIININLIY